MSVVLVLGGKCSVGGSMQDCYDHIERYAAGGLDEGLIEDKVRSSCNLPSKHAKEEVELGADHAGEDSDPQFDPELDSLFAIPMTPVGALVTAV